ncbi:hypothetical protein HPB48_020644 [Haemaphysalis longicornis]|uniref:Uncharacterized protein n=1 Tax=Haemaphysalis longicornis TaxID=44386 RepID=A0A9J6FNH0_HAELO|nr:hypothetical protein HPB48_020644 [Haemaphysalis longicornis]
MYRHVSNGEDAQTPRDRPQLREDAVPTVFPNKTRQYTAVLPVLQRQDSSEGLTKRFKTEKVPVTCYDCEEK